MPRRISSLVIMPTSRPSLPRTGRPLTRLASMMRAASASVVVGETETTFEFINAEMVISPSCACKDSLWPLSALHLDVDQIAKILAPRVSLAASITATADRLLYGILWRLVVVTD